jgi:hypothetical protein
MLHKHRKQLLGRLRSHFQKKLLTCRFNEAQRASSGGPLGFLKILFVHRKIATRTPRARPLAWCLVRLLAVVGLFWARSLARSARLDRSAYSLNARSALV